MRRIAWREKGERRTGLPFALAVVLFLATAAGASLTACAGGTDTGSETAGSAPAEMSPEDLGRLGGRIHAEPERAEELLAEAGLTPEELEARVREVTADPTASERYAEGFRGTSSAEADAAGG